MSATIYPSLEFTSFPQSIHTRRYFKFVTYWSSRTTVEVPSGYTEKHHVYPKSIFGNNKTVVVLTAKEHFVAHKLLSKMYDITDNKSNHYKMKLAFGSMTTHQKTRSLSSRQYSECRNSRLGYKISNETRKKMSKNRKITAQKMKDSGYIRVISDEGRASFRILHSNVAKKFNFIHTSGLEERNISVLELIRKYPDQKLNSGGLWKTSDSGRMHKGWRINDPNIILKPYIDPNAILSDHTSYEIVDHPRLAVLEDRLDDIVLGIDHTFYSRFQSCDTQDERILVEEYVSQYPDRQ